MMISNGASIPTNRAPMANAAEAVIAALGRPIMGHRLVVNGKSMTILENIEVRGSNQRDTTKCNPLYRDLVGRYTLEPRGHAVGLLLRGGTNGRLCHIGLYAEVSSAPHH